jgi:hypothetical protein
MLFNDFLQDAPADAHPRRCLVHRKDSIEGMTLFVHLTHRYFRANLPTHYPIV